MSADTLDGCFRVKVNGVMELTSPEGGQRTLITQIHWLVSERGTVIFRVSVEQTPIIVIAAPVEPRDVSQAAIQAFRQLLPPAPIPQRQ